MYLLKFFVTTIPCQFFCIYSFISMYSNGYAMLEMICFTLNLAHSRYREPENIVLRHSVLGYRFCSLLWHCVLSIGSHHSAKRKILNISFSRVGIEPATCRGVYFRKLESLRHDRPSVS